jgi:membrane carboxypeptidase/penicillin-binding protein
VLPESGSKAGRYQVGLSDGRILPFEAATSLRGRLKPFDVVRVKVSETRTGAARAELRIQPQVQGTAIVLENRTGRILAMAGGFSYASSQLNRATQTYRQPGSALKPVTYLAALANGLQPNTLVSDSPLTLPPIGKASRRAQDAYWSPQNYDGSSRSTISLRQALEHSRNLATVHLLTGGIADRPEAALDKVCDLAREAQIYRTCVRYYPFILGAQPVRALDLARFYAGIANEGAVPEPHAIESVSLRGQVRYEFGAPRLQKIGSADPAAFYQLKSILQGVVSRGTAARRADLAPYVAGKTGTTDDAIDAWFVGFSNDVTIAVWVGYDNAKGRRTLGDGRTGANVAIPIFEPILRASWNIYPRSVLAPPTSEASMKLVRDDAATSPKRSRFQIVEYLRKDAKGKSIDARYALLSKDRSEASARRRSRGHDALALSTGNGTQAWPWFGQERPSGARQGWNGDLGAPQYNMFDQHGVFRFRY